MYKNFNITESEREQILNRLKENGYRQPTNKKVISEQPEDELEQNPMEDSIGNLDIHFVIECKDVDGILYLLRNKKRQSYGYQYGVYNISSKTWLPGYDPYFRESGVKLYETQTGDSVLIEKFTLKGMTIKSFYTLYNVNDIDDTIRKVKFLNTREHADVVKNLKPLDEPVDQGGGDEIFGGVSEEDEMMDKGDYMAKHGQNSMNEGKEILKDVFKKLIK
jgi:hypothetical protein